MDLWCRLKEMTEKYDNRVAEWLSHSLSVQRGNFQHLFE